MATGLASDKATVASQHMCQFVIHCHNTMCTIFFKCVCGTRIHNIVQHMEHTNCMQHTQCNNSFIIVVNRFEAK